MMTHLDADVTVVGAGPAGSTAAKLLADRGLKVLLLDRAAFPRYKTCASWINRLAFERFPYLQLKLDDLVESSFYGMTFYDPSLRRHGSFPERRPSGYLSLRSKFDDGLRRIAIAAGAAFHGSDGVVRVEQDGNEVRARTAQGRTYSARVLIGADGVSSRVAMCASLRRSWARSAYVMCANADIAFPAGEISEFYGEHSPLLVYLEHQGLQGYGWIFPKRQHICVGIGAMLDDHRRIRSVYSRFFQDAQAAGHLPPELRAEATHFDLDPVGAVYAMPKLTEGRVMLIGDAGGFVSGATGEGIYPGMVSAQVACQVIEQALASSSIEQGLTEFNQAWRAALGHYVKRLPGGEEESGTRSRLEMIFRSSLVARVAGRIFLYGEPASFATFLRSLTSIGLSGSHAFPKTS
ncbi:MAG: NAD(P)/FAD-dependent oxidoreductase [Terriglobia bacterium]